MLRGLYTAASGMIARMAQLDVIANNLANVNTPGYKRDKTIFKSFPEMIIRRINDIYKFTLLKRRLVDPRPKVGLLNTGVEVNEIYTVHEAGPLKATDRPTDLALEEEGKFFVVEAPNGIRYTRAGNFIIDSDGYLKTPSGMKVLGKNGYIRLPVETKGNFSVDELGRVYWVTEAGEEIYVDQLKIVTFNNLRGLKKEGYNLWRETEWSGPAVETQGKVLQGFLEMSNVNPVTEMVRMIEAHRNYESSQRMILSMDDTLREVITQVGRV